MRCGYDDSDDENDDKDDDDDGDDNDGRAFFEVLFIFFLTLSQIDKENEVFALLNRKNAKQNYRPYQSLVLHFYDLAARKPHSLYQFVKA